MRKRRMEGAARGALLALALAGMTAGGAAAQSSERAWLGVSTQAITEGLREGLDYRGDGVLVTGVSSDSPADRAGIRKGDVLVTFNSRTIDSPAHLVDLVRDARVGQSVSIGIVRNGERRSVSARLATRSAASEDRLEAPAPRVPRAPRAPSAPRVRTFEWDGDHFELPEGRAFTMLQGMGRGRLGVHIQDLNADMADALGVGGGKGVLVTEVVRDTPAEKAGIRGGDVIVEVGGTAVSDVSDLQRELRERKGTVAITLVRRGARRTVNPDIGEAPRVMRWESDGDGDGDRRVIRIPDVRRRVERDMAEGERDRSSSRDDLERQMRELREELRELRRRLEADGRN